MLRRKYCGWFLVKKETSLGCTAQTWYKHRHIWERMISLSGHFTSFRKTEYTVIISTHHCRHHAGDRGYRLLKNPEQALWPRRWHLWKPSCRRTSYQRKLRLRYCARTGDLAARKQKRNFKNIVKTSGKTATGKMQQPKHGDWIHNCIRDLWVWLVRVRENIKLCLFFFF